MRERSPRSTGALLAVLLLSLGGCAGVADVTGTATQTDIFQLRAEMATLQRSVREARTQVDALASRVESSPRAQPADTDRQVTILAQRLETLAGTVAALGKRMDEGDARLETLSRQARVAPAPRATPAPATPATPPLAVPPGARPATGSLQPQDLYQAAYIDFSKGTYQAAVTGFREFLRRHPEHELSDNAQYWIGEAHVSLARQYVNAGQADRAAQALQQAVQEFRKVIANYPRGDKAPTALYKEALTLLDLSQPEVAQARLQYLVENFPQAEETPLARDKLAALRER